MGSFVPGWNVTLRRFLSFCCGSILSGSFVYMLVRVAFYLLFLTYYYGSIDSKKLKPNKKQLLIFENRAENRNRPLPASTLERARFNFWHSTIGLAMRMITVFVACAVAVFAITSGQVAAEPLCSISFDESTDVAAACSAASSCSTIDIDTTRISLVELEVKLPFFSACLPNVSTITGDFAFDSGSMPLLEKVKVRRQKQPSSP